ncbi:MAG: hypothetical protein ACOX45_05945 [Acutalibacteraceae bacterium]
MICKSKGLYHSNSKQSASETICLCFTYNVFGNILTISETTRANKDNESAYVLKQSYEYDSLDRLTRENDVNTGNTILYEYDAGGTQKPASTISNPDITSPS